MKNKTFYVMSFCLTLIFFSCGKDTPIYPESTEYIQKSEVGYLPEATEGVKQGLTQGAIQISGIAFFDAADDCNSAGQGADFAFIMTGDLEGCWYTYVDEFECSPGGTYREIGREYFVGTYDEEAGTFWTTYRFEAKYEDCDEDGSYVGAQIKGRCQHPIVNDSGTGVFEGVTGRLDFKDDIEVANNPYRGHLKFTEL